jgi:predicted SprT family Zn-dependent metalloprotease
MEPYARIATGDYYDMLKEDGKDNALGGILHSIAHELTHYYQWINDVHLTDRGEEIQASRYASSIVFEYSQTREHP